MIELPAGLVGDIAGQEHEAWAIAAERELLEETGYHAGPLRGTLRQVQPPLAWLTKSSRSCWPLNWRGARRVAATSTKKSRFTKSRWMASSDICRELAAGGVRDRHENLHRALFSQPDSLSCNCSWPL